MAVDAGSIYSSVRIRLDSLDGDIKGVYARLDALESQITQKMDKPTKAVTASFSSMSLAGVAAFLGIGKAIKSAVGISASFEQSMANVASVSGATSAEFDALTSAAEEAGEKTRYSASQAADALYALSSAGFSATQSTQALSGVLSLAQATGSDLGSTAESMASTISQYGLAATDAARVSNVFAAAAATSQANMEKLTAGLRQVGPVAGSLGISLEETVANLDALYNKGFQGEQAGTALRSILLDLADSSSTVVLALEKQGLTYDQINPKTVGLSQAMKNIADANVDLTTTFGKVSAAEAIALVQTAKDGTKNLVDMQKQITGTDYAAQSAAKMNDTLKGTLDELSSESEATSIKFGKEFTPALRALAEGAKVVVGWIGKLPAPLLAIVGSAAAVIAGIAGITGALSVMGITISATAPEIAAVALVMTGVAAAGTLVAKHFADQQHVTEQLNAVTQQLKTTSEEYKTTQDEMATKADTLTKAEKEVLENRKKLLALDMQKKILELADAYDKANKNIEKQKSDLKKTTEETDYFEASVQTLEKKLKDQGWNQKEINKQVAIYKGKHLEDLYKKQTDQAGTLTKAQTDLQDSINSVAMSVADGTINIDYLKTVNVGLYNAIMAQVGALKQQEASVGSVGGAVADTAPKLTAWQEALKKALDVKDVSTGAKAVSEYVDETRTQLARAVTAAKATGGDVADVYGEYANQVSEAIKALLMSGEYTEGEKTITDLIALMDEFKGKQKGMTDATDAQTEAYKNFSDQIESLGNYSGSTFDTMKEKLIELATEAQLAGTITKTQFDDLIKNLDLAKSKTLDWSDAYTTFQSGILSGFESIGEAIGNGTLQWSDWGKLVLNAISSTLKGIGAELDAYAVEAQVISLLKTMAPELAVPIAIAGSALAYGLAGTVSSWASNMATGGIVEPTASGTITRQAENGYGEVDFNTSPTGQKFINQISSAIASQLGGASGGSQTINLVVDGKQITRVVTRRQTNGDY